MNTLALVSQKGGAGKSTLSIHLAVEGTARGLRTLLIDVDPQGSAANWGDRRGEKLPDVATENPARLGKAIERAAAEGYDFVVIDTPPHADQSALYAARIADLVAIPCRLSILDLDSIEATIELCHLAKKPARVILNAAPVGATTMLTEATAGIQSRGGVLCPAVVRDRAALRHALGDGLVAQEYEPDCRAAQEITALFACLLADMSTRPHCDA
jgi:chromosome partitioning protein